MASGVRERHCQGDVFSCCKAREEDCWCLRDKLWKAIISCLSRPADCEGWLHAEVDAGETTSAMVKLAREIDESASNVIVYGIVGVHPKTSSRDIGQSTLFREKAVTQRV